MLSARPHRQRTKFLVQITGRKKMKERIMCLRSWINAQDSFEVKDIGRQLLSLIEEQEKRITLLEGAKNTEQANQPDSGKTTASLNLPAEVIGEEPVLEGWVYRPPEDCKCCFNCKHWHKREYIHCQHSGPWGGNLTHDKNCVFTPRVGA